MGKDTLQLILDSELYNLSQSKVLQKMIDISTDNKVAVSQEYLSKSLRLSRSTIYAILKTLIKDKLLSKIDFEKNTYLLNQEKLDYIYNCAKKKMVDLPLSLAS